jgi:hypothetical protein
MGQTSVTNVAAALRFRVFRIAKFISQSGYVQRGVRVKRVGVRRLDAACRSGATAAVRDFRDWR